MTDFFTALCTALPHFFYNINRYHSRGRNLWESEFKCSMWLLFVELFVFIFRFSFICFCFFSSPIELSAQACDTTNAKSKGGKKKESIKNLWLFFFFKLVPFEVSLCFIGFCRIFIAVFFFFFFLNWHKWRHPIPGSIPIWYTLCTKMLSLRKKMQAILR